MLCSHKTVSLVVLLFAGSIQSTLDYCGLDDLFPILLCVLAYLTW